MTVLSGVPQGLVLGRLLFVLFINDIHVDDGILSKISKFVDDTKLCRAVGSDHEADILREDLRRMFRCLQDWQVLFILEKCSVMHMGKRNQELYEIGVGLEPCAEVVAVVVVAAVVVVVVVAIE